MTSASMKLPRVTLTVEQAKLWQATTTAFLWHCPAFSHVFYHMLDRVGSVHHAVFTDHPSVPIAATDGRGIAFNPKNYFKYNLNERVFVFNHEIMHCMLNHPAINRMFMKQGFIQYDDGVKLPYIHRLKCWADDYVINDMLVQGHQGRLPPDGLWDVNIGSQFDATIDVYRYLYLQRQEWRGGDFHVPSEEGSFPSILEFETPVGGGGEGEGEEKGEEKGEGKGEGEGDEKNGMPERTPGGQMPFDVLLMPGTIEGINDTIAVLERNEAEWRTVIETAQQIARLQGKMPANLERAFTKELEPQVSWKEHLLTLVSRRLGSDGYSWRRPDRRLIIRDIYAPGRTGHGAKLIVVGGDTSGSVNDEEEDMFFAEMSGILDDVHPEELVIMWCDAAVHDVDYCSDVEDLEVIRRRGVGGRGGTDFRPVFDKIDELGMTPDCLVYLTDGHGDFPEVAPSFPVIWASIDKQPEGFPFGDVVMVPRQAKREE